MKLMEFLALYDRRLLFFCCTVAGIFGASMGSFLNCAAWRITREESFLKGRSHCPACGHVLNVPDLVPIISWLFLRGRCRYCGKTVSPRYPLTELFFAAVTICTLLRFDLTVVCLRNYVFLCCLFCLSLVDAECYLIPDGCVMISVAVWILSAPFVADRWTAVWIPIVTGVGLSGMFYGVGRMVERVTGKESLGGGDVKLLAAVGLYLGPAGALFAALLTCVGGLAVSRVILRRGWGERFPLGPVIAAATAFMLLFGDGLTAWYLGLLGFS